MMRSESHDFWNNKQVLVTGHTGFKGSWLTHWLTSVGANVHGISLPPETEPSLFSSSRLEDRCDSRICDITDKDKLKSLIEQITPEIVFHLAAQPLVKRSYEAPIQTISTNVLGTANLLESLKKSKNLRAIVAITTDKVYQNQEWIWPYRESDRLGGSDPYSASKAASELIIDCYKKSFFDTNQIGMATIRGGNVIGGGDWSNDRIIPDVIRSWRSNKALHLRYPEAIRPWQHVLETVHAYVTVAKNIFMDPTKGGHFNTGPDNTSSITVRDMASIAADRLGGLQIKVDASYAGPKETIHLTLDNAKIRNVHAVSPNWSAVQAIEKTIQWYKDFYQGKPVTELCNRDIKSFIEGF